MAPHVADFVVHAGDRDVGGEVLQAHAGLTEIAFKGYQAQG